ncbi:MAG: ribosome-associated translation inhibitor RaiA [Patescibacteria group bacterium]
MNIEFFLQNIELDPKVKDKIAEKISRLKKYNAKISSAKLDLSFNPAHNKEEVIRLEAFLCLPKKDIYTSVRAGNLSDAVDLLANKLRHQLRELKDRKEEKRKKTRQMIRRKKEAGGEA